MMKSHDEIKKELEDAHKSCYLAIVLGDPLGYPTAVYASYEATGNAIALIQQLEADVESLRKFGENLSARNEELHGKLIDLEAERDAAVRDLKVLCECMACDHAEKGPDSTPCNECTNCNGMVVESKWQWHGVQKEE